MLLLIDGHNLIGKMPNISLADANDEEALLLHIRQYRAKTKRKVVVVFDSGGGHHLGSKRSRAGLTIQYARRGQSADQIIISRLRREKNPGQVLVVTSDRAIQQAARAVRANIMTSADFAAELVNTASKAQKETDVKLSEDEVEHWLEIFNSDSD